MLPGWRELHAQGLTAVQAAAARGASVESAYQWAGRNGVLWARRPAEVVVELPALPPIGDPRDLDVTACRKLWQSVLIEQARALGYSQRCERHVTPARRREAEAVKRWFDGRDGAEVCDLAGVDVMRARATAARMLAAFGTGRD
jgi:hypothetical protein